MTLSGPLLTALAVVLYGLLHSLLASPPAKALAHRLLGPISDRSYRLAYNVIAGLTLLPVLGVVAVYPGEVLYRLQSPWLGLALLGQASAVAILLLGVLQTDVWHFLGLRQLMGPADGRAPRLVTTGLYRWVRHPLYTAGLLFLWLTPLMTTSVLVFNLGFSLYIYIGSVFEEWRLLTEFGDAYASYQSSVPRLIPTGRRMRS